MAFRVELLNFGGVFFQGVLGVEKSKIAAGFSDLFALSNSFALTKAAFGNGGIRAPYSQSYLKDCKSMDGWTGECGWFVCQAKKVQYTLLGCPMKLVNG